MDSQRIAPAQDTLCLHRLSANQKPPALLRMLQNRAQWFHENPARSPILLSLENQSQIQANSNSA